MFLQDFSNYVAPASNDSTFARSPAKQLDDAISGIINNGSFDYAECSVSEGVWDVAQAADYLVSKAIGFIDLTSQELLRQTLHDVIKMNILC